MKIGCTWMCEPSSPKELVRTTSGSTQIWTSPCPSRPLRVVQDGKQKEQKEVRAPVKDRYPGIGEHK
jgi:hypothetical protein